MPITAFYFVLLLREKREEKEKRQKVCAGTRVKKLLVSVPSFGDALIENVQGQIFLWSPHVHLNARIQQISTLP